MKNLYILRHSSALNDSLINDINRPLSKEGIEFCYKIADFIKANSLFPEITFCSNAVRTRQTIETIAGYLDIKFNINLKEELYNSNINILYKFLQSIDDNYNDILIVGHNPSLSNLIHSLSKSLTEFVLSPGSFIYVQIPIKSWQLLNPTTGGIVQALFTNEF